MALQIGLPGQGGMTKTAVGIDLGTTNSLIAIVKDNEPRVLPDPTGRHLLPSAVAYTQDGIRVGREALEVAVEHPAETLISVKRLMGRSASDPEVQSSLYAHRVQPGDEGIIRLTVGEREVTPVEVSAEILRRLKQNAEKTLRRRVTQAVITVPAYFDDAQRQATRDAGRLAGLEVMRLLNEPTAAALAYGLEKEREGTYAIYDLGGGTFDISILKLEGGVFEVLSTGGNTHLGGDDFDDALANLMLVQTGHVLDETLSAGTRRFFRQQARSLKEALTDAATASVQVRDASGRALELELTRAVLEDLCRPIVERTGPACLAAMKDAGLTRGTQGRGTLNGVVLVGGATRMPLVRAYVASLFGVEPFTGVDPDQVVALGAAIQAALLVGWKKDVLLLDVNPLSLGIETMGGIVEKLILRNSTIPASAGQVFTTYADGQTAMDIHVVQGERELARDNRSLARFSLRGIPPLPAGVARVLVAFRIDTDGILRVTAKEERTGVEQQVEIRPSYGLTDQEVETMLRDALSHAQEDVSQRMLIDARVEAERILGAFELAYQSDGAFLLTPEEARPMLEQAQQLRALHDGDDHHAIREGIEALDRVSLPLAQRRMERGLQQALAGQAVTALADELRERPMNAHMVEQLQKLDSQPEEQS